MIVCPGVAGLCKLFTATVPSVLKFRIAPGPLPVPFDVNVWNELLTTSTGEELLVRLLYITWIELIPTGAFDGMIAFTTTLLT